MSAETQPVEGHPKATVCVNHTAKVLATFYGPSAVRDAERFISHQPERLVESGYFGLDSSEFRRCCNAYLHPEADHNHD